ncbi:hypothetical protein E3N88_35664 [Mikania micrantha]|uniref:Protein kinase domain-containing protein n=1 Tax=Mikania micrantha TaxID=192012 RepID=A0A5N6M1J2_9ASTR|nr:hypothetical protein E3N88_35664 [Mikania micrantha]
MTVPGPPMALQATGLTETKTVVNLQAPNTRARSKETYAKQLIKKKRKLAFESKKNAEKERNIRYGGETKMAFRDEIELLRHIRHPNVVQFLGA